MKLLVFLSILVFVYGRSHISQQKVKLSENHYGSPSYLLKHITSEGYNGSNYTVKTSDGYILDIFRVNTISKNNDASSDEDCSSEEINRPVVLLMHGFLSSSDDFTLPGLNRNRLAFYLADKGYDVFVGNSRGNIYGRRHTSLNPNKDSAFWQFCWDDISTKDLPAIIDKILLVTGQTKLNYIGHMQGSTIFYVMASQMPEYTNKIEKMASLGPLAYIGQSTNPVLKYIERYLDQKSWQIKNLGVNEFKPSDEFITEIKNSCRQENYQDVLCNNIYFLTNGYNSNNYDEEVINLINRLMPQGGSVRQIMHYALLVKTGKFQRYMGSNEEYDLSNVNVPIGLFYTPEDTISKVEDVEYLATKLPNVVHKQKFSQMSNNLELIYGKDVENVVFSKIFEFFQK